MDLLRGIQRQTGGFTEFVPLSLIHQEAPMYRRGLVPGVRPGATGVEVIKMHALARLILGPTFRNVQSSWVKEGPKMAQYLLASGANDVGGTLINESISPSAGAGYGQLVPPVELRRLIRDAGRVPARRGTLYELIKVYADAGDEEDSPLDHVADAATRFGSYRALSTSKQFRFLHPDKTEAPSRSSRRAKPVFTSAGGWVTIRPCPRRPRSSAVAVSFTRNPETEDRRMAKPMTKSATIAHLAQKSGLAKKQVVELFEHLEGLAIKEAKNVFVLPHFGRLVLANRKARMGRNPQTGQPIKIKAKTVVRLRAAKAFKDAVLG